MSRLAYPSAAPLTPAAPGVLLVRPISPPLQLTSRKKCCVVTMGLLQLVLGVACIVFNSMAIAVDTHFSSLVSPGIWGGILVVICGAFGLAGGMKQSKPLIVTFLVLSIIAACMACVIFAIAVTSLVVGTRDYHQATHDAAMAADGMLIICGVTQIVVAIFSAIVSCGPLCCPPEPAMPVQYVKDSEGKVFILHQEAAPPPTKL